MAVTLLLPREEIESATGLTQSNTPEPKVITADVAAILRQVVRPGDDDSGASVALIAEKAQTSTRTIYRVLAESSDALSLDLADRLVIAADSHLVHCRLLWPDGRVTNYL